MSIRDLIKDDVPNYTNELKRLPTKFGLVVDRYNELRKQQWHQSVSDRDLDSMSKPLK